eukprot:3934445-Rhodomonas_salina.2
MTWDEGLVGVQTQGREPETAREAHWPRAAACQVQVRVMTVVWRGVRIRGVPRAWACSGTVLADGGRGATIETLPTTLKPATILKREQSVVARPRPPSARCRTRKRCWRLLTAARQTPRPL